MIDKSMIILLEGQIKHHALQYLSHRIHTAYNFCFKKVGRMTNKGTICAHGVLEITSWASQTLANLFFDLT